ncbi:MAG: hypothetical protein GY756_20540, partial [bacterium]|nr:hypothetical protein [bacterium]
MVETQKSIELSVKEYIRSLGLNPQRVKYKKTASTNIDTTSAQWAIDAPDSRALLLSCGWINWKATITKQSLLNVATNFVNNGIKASWKPCLPFANSMSNMQLHINGASISIPQPRRFMSILNMMFAGRKGAEQTLQTAGGCFPDLDGWTPFDAATRGIVSPTEILDRSLWKKQQYFCDQLTKSNDANGIGANDLNGTNNRVIQCFEPIIAPPFNPFFYLKKGMPDYCWFKHM